MAFNVDSRMSMEHSFAKSSHEKQIGKTFIITLRAWVMVSSQNRFRMLCLESISGGALVSHDGVRHLREISCCPIQEDLSQVDTRAPFVSPRSAGNWLVDAVERIQGGEAGTQAFWISVDHDHSSIHSRAPPPSLVPLRRQPAGNRHPWLVQLFSSNSVFRVHRAAQFVVRG